MGGFLHAHPKTEYIVKIYPESCSSKNHFKRMKNEVQVIVNAQR